MENVIVNKVAESALTTIDLETYLPTEAIAVFDMKPYLFMELILKEKDFREALKTIDWNVYARKHVALTCTADAIIPVWAYMLVTTHLTTIATSVFFGNEQQTRNHILLQNIATIQADDYTDKRVVIKGCGDENIAEAAYVAITAKLKPVVKSIMYGEPCSTVPIYKKR